MDLLGEMSFDIHTGGERVSVALENDDGDVTTRLESCQRLLKFARHSQVDYVERRVDQLQASDGRCDIYFHSSCGGGEHRPVQADRSVYLHVLNINR